MIPYLRLLGGARLEDETGLVTGPVARRHPLALLALLATAPARTLGRSKLVGLLWPESAEQTARNRMNTCVHRVRSGLGADVLVSVADELRLNDGALGCDVWEFRAAIDSGDLEAAVRLYQGPFLEGFVLRGSTAFEQRVDRERARLEAGHREALEKLADEAGARGDAVAAVRWWRRRSELDPFDSRVTRCLMEALRAAGNRAEALRVARVHARVLDQELGTDPAVDIEDLAARIRADAGTSTVPVGMADEGGPPPLDPRAVAVLPFESIGGGEWATAFAAGFHSDLITHLSRVGALTVISRSSVLRYREDVASIPEVAEALGVGTVVEGEVREVAGRVRVNVQLIDARRDVHRWAESYDRELTAENVFEIQSELASKVVMSLEAELTPREDERRRDHAPTENLEAYRFHALGKARLDARTERGMREAIEYFRRASERDPGYAPALAGLADALALLYQYGYVTAEPALAEARESARRALELDPSLAEAYAALALLHDIRCEGPTAIRSLRRAIELQPNYAQAHNWMSWESALLGWAEQTLESARQAVRLDPLSPEAVSNLALGLLVNGRLEDAIREARHVGDLEPHFTTGPFYEALASYDLGRFDDVVALLDGVPVKWAGSGASVTLALAHAAAGRPTPAHAALERFRDAGDTFAAGLLHAALGEADRAAEMLEGADLGTYWPALSVHHLYRSLWEQVGDVVDRDALVRRARRRWGLEPDGSLPDDG